MVRVIFLVCLAAAWWIVAPDQFTAAARTATGTGIRSAGTGGRAHWRAGRGDRALRRTKRRDRWAASGGFQRDFLRLENGAVIAGSLVRGAGRLVRAAVSPVPGAAREGWSKGRDRHRQRAGDRPVGLALDPPWWHPGTGPEDTAGQVGDRCPWTVTPHALSLVGVQRACGRPATDGVFCAEHAAQAQSTPCLTCGQMLGSDHVCGPYGTGPEDTPGQAGVRVYDDPFDLFQDTPRDSPTGQPRDSPGTPAGTGPERAQDESGDSRPGDPDAWPMVAEVREIPDCDIHSQILGTQGVPAAYDAETRSGPWAFMCPDCFERHGTGGLGLGVGQRLVLKAPPIDHPAGLVPAGATPTATPTGGSMSAPTELRNLIAVQDFARQVDNLSEASDFVVVAERARTVSEQVRGGGFGSEMGLALDHLQEVAGQFATAVDSMRAEAATNARTAASVRGA